MANHVVSYIRDIPTSSEEGIISYFSPMLRTIDTTNTDDLSFNKHIEKIIEDIKHQGNTIGFFSSKRMGICEFDNKMADNIITKELKECCLFDIVSPYNNVMLDTRNQWKFDCLTKFYQIFKNILFIKENSLPSIINIKRSNGTIQKGRINGQNAISLYKSSKDNYSCEHLGIKICFNEAGKEISQEINPDFLKYRKIMLLEDLFDCNPNIEKIELEYSLLDYKKYQDVETIENINIIENVVKYFNNSYTDWIENNITKEYIDGNKLSISENQ